MKIETTQLLFVQSMLNRSSDLSGRMKLVKFGLFIYSKLEPKTTKFIEIYISMKSPGPEDEQDVFILEISSIRAKL